MNKEPLEVTVCCEYKEWWEELKKFLQEEKKNLCEDMKRLDRTTDTIDEAKIYKNWLKGRKYTVVIILDLIQELEEE